MSKNISIKEGGKAYNFTVDKIKTGLASSDYAEWIPEDTNVTGTLVANKKWATYKASDLGILGFHTVYVNETGEGQTWDEYPATGTDDVTIKENGTQENYTSVSRVDLAGAGDVSRELFVLNNPVATTTKTITVDGDTPDAVYEASGDGVVAYFEFTVRGLADQIELLYNFLDGKTYFEAGDSIFLGCMWSVLPEYENGSRWSCPEYTGNPSTEATYSPTVVPSGVDSFTVTATWARYDDGATLTTQVTVPVGQAVTYPHHIDITTLPTKTAYVDGESIDITGIVVTAYNEDGTVWTSNAYPNGIIPINELSFTPATFSATDAWFTADEAYLIEDANTYLGRVQDRYFYKSVAGKAIAFFRNDFLGETGWVGPILLSLDKESANTNYANSSAVAYGGLTWYFNLYYHYHSTDYETPLPVFQDITFVYTADSVASALELTNAQWGGNGCTVTVSWMSPGGVELSDTFTVTLDES